MSHAQAGRETDVQQEWSVSIHAGVRASIRYFDQGEQCQAVKVLPNEYYVAAPGDGLLLTTVLGSCVAACVRDGANGVGGMNHFILPGVAPTESGRAPAGSMRYGQHAMDTLIEALIRAGAQRQRLEAKVFGGGAVLAGVTRMAVGASNAKFVRAYLERAGIPVIAHDLGGTQARRVNFFPASGLTRVRRFGGQQADAAEREALAWAARVRALEHEPDERLYLGNSKQEKQ